MSTIRKRNFFRLSIAVWLAGISTIVAVIAAENEPTKADAGNAPAPKNYEAARWDPIHFKPAIATATDQQCLACHQEVLDTKVRDTSPAGMRTDQALAWYQTLDTYAGQQETFHRRHLVTQFANDLMQMKCITCHQGNGPRDEAPLPSQAADPGFTLRKAVDPKICLMCHGQFPYQNMGLPGPWAESGSMVGNNCLTCHASIRTHRHQVNFLKADAIEARAKESSDVCYGCHGGRAWYRISFPYPRHPWPGMPQTTPDWAKDRPTESQQRFLESVDTGATQH